MSDDELIKFGKIVRGLSEPRVSVTPYPWKARLEEARVEWAETASERMTSDVASANGIRQGSVLKPVSGC
jgi:hypothetical protein